MKASIDIIQSQKNTQMKSFLRISLPPCSITRMEYDLRAAEAAVLNSIAHILLEDLPAVTADAIGRIILPDVASYLGLADLPELLLAEEHLDVLDADHLLADLLVSLVGAPELELLVLLVALLFPAAVGDALPAEGVPAVVEGEVGADDVLAEDALRVDLLIQLADPMLALFDGLHAPAELYCFVSEVYLAGEFWPAVFALEFSGDFEDLV